MTPEAQELLTLVKNTSPDDKAGCDEIDARFWCYCRRYKFKGMLNNKYPQGNAPFSYYGGDKSGAIKRVVTGAISASHSLDTLQAVQEKYLEGWHLLSLHMDKTNYARLCKQKTGDVMDSKNLPTMHFAWLYAIICAIDYERREK